MIFLQLFLTFLKIGIFTFGGGYAMIALIQDEVVSQHHWLTSQEFTDLVAISQTTPGPIGINTATYSGYTAIVNAGYDHLWGILGAIMASFAVILLPTLLMFVVTKLLQRYINTPAVSYLLQLLRLVVVGLIASAALGLLSTENFGNPGSNFQFLLSIIIFIAAFIASYRFKVSPILLICLSGIIGLVAYSL
ncbi:MAG: chromate transporter [Bacteroidales bacterium]|nr:chromate transporter [Bacteroidales bacterium]